MKTGSACVGTGNKTFFRVFTLRLVMEALQAMDRNPTFHLSLSHSGERIPVTEDQESKTYLAFSEPYSRFAALKIYGLDPYRDELYREQLRDRLKEVQKAFTNGIAFPFEVGEHEGRFYQLCQILPGNSLMEIVEWRGPLPPQDVFLIARRLLSTLTHARETYRLSPNLDPDQVFLWRGRGIHWELGLADYDLRRTYGDRGPEEERAAFTKLALLLYYLGTGILRKSLPVKTGDLEDSRLKTHCPDLWRFYLQLFRFANAENLCPLRYLEALVDNHCSVVNAKLELGSPPPDRPFLDWLPDGPEFPEPFDSRGRDLERGEPFTFEATDRLRECTARVHFLPPHSMTQSQAYEDGFQRMRQVTTCKAPSLRAVRSVMADPHGRVVAETASDGISLSQILDQRASFSRVETVILLSKVHQAAQELTAELGAMPSLALQDIYLLPSADLPGGIVREQRTWLADAEAYSIQLRPLRTNLFFEELPGFGNLGMGFEGPLGQQLFRAEHSYATLAYSVVTHVMNCEGEDMPDEVAEVFRKVFSQRFSNEVHQRQQLLSRLSKTLGVTDRVREIVEHSAFAGAKGNLAAASAAASMAILLALCLAFLR